MHPIDYTLKRSTKARTMRLAIYPDGAVVVTAPRFFGIRMIEEFVAKHAEWIRLKVKETRGRTILRIRRGDIPAMKKRSLALAEERCQHYARLLDVVYAKISIRTSKTRWGSCSFMGNLAFNYKLAALPPRLADYVVLHEIAHLIEFNHSKRFWAHVERIMPDHKELRKELKNIATVYY